MQYIPTALSTSYKVPFSPVTEDIQSTWELLTYLNHYKFVTWLKSVEIDSF